MTSPRPRHKAEELTGTFSYEKNVFGRGDDRTIIGVLEDGTIVKGRAREEALETGLVYRFYGHWITHPRWGRQFTFQSFVLAAPSGMRGTIAYLQRCRGVGRKRAQTIWETFGPDSIEKIKSEPKTVAEAIDGLTTEAATEAADYFRSIESLEAVTIELTELLGGRGFPRNLIQKVIEETGNRGPEIIRENPYWLMTFSGVGFFRADQLYLELGKDPVAVERQKWCIWHALHSDSAGHTWYSIEFCQRHLEKNVAGTGLQFNEALHQGLDEGLLAIYDDGKRGWIAENEKAVAESRVANFIHQAESEAATQWPPIESCLDLSDHQRTELAKAFGGVIGILGGRPGTGKTYTLASVIRALEGRRVAVAAPTGKAAVRATESLQAVGLNIQATTIHRLLVAGVVDGAWQFAHNEENPLPYDFVFIDEASMIDTPLMASFLAARPTGCHVLLVGDSGQLSPVGHGAPLRDLIAAKVPHGLLVDIHRNSGRIVQACKEIAEQHTFTPSRQLDLEVGENLLWIERSRPDQQIAELRGFLERLKAGSKYDSVWGCQVLVPVNEKSPLARKALNKLLQTLFNADGKTAVGNPFRVADKIICTQNGWLPVDEKWLRSLGRPVRSIALLDYYATPTGQVEIVRESHKTRVANGELAKVRFVAPRFMKAFSQYPDRLVTIPRGSDGEEGDTGCNWELGYAISTHKSQGSEWPIVVVMIDSYPGAVRLVDRHWIYTALSRGKDFDVCIGKLRLAQSACTKSHMWARKTFLKESIESLRLAGIAQAWDSELMV